MTHPRFGRTLLAGALLGAALLTTTAAEAEQLDPAQPVVTSDDNAALRYLRAMRLLSDETRDAVDRLSESLLEPTFNPAPEDRRAIASSSGTIEVILRGAAMPRSDFGIDWDLGPEAMVPHLHDLRVAARLLLADARLRAEAGETDAAAERLAGAFRMAHHAGQDRLLISSLVSVAVSRQAAGVTERLLDAGLLDRAARERVVAAMGSLAGDDPFGAKAAIAQEGRMMTAWLRTQIATPEGRDRVASTIFAEGGADDEAAASFLATIAEPEAETHIDLVELAYRQAIAAWDSEDPERAFSALALDLRDGAFGPLAAWVTPALGKAQRNTAETASQLDALRRRLQE